MELAPSSKQPPKTETFDEGFQKVADDFLRMGFVVDWCGRTNLQAELKSLSINVVVLNPRTIAYVTSNAEGVLRDPVTDLLYPAAEVYKLPADIQSRLRIKAEVHTMNQSTQAEQILQVTLSTAMHTARRVEQAGWPTTLIEMHSGQPDKVQYIRRAVYSSVRAAVADLKLSGSTEALKLEQELLLPETSS